jgi:Uma2 family endonuclease
MPTPSEPAIQRTPAGLQPLPPELWPNIDHIDVDDGAPVDNVFSEKQMRLLTESLHSSWKPDWPFVAFANVGLFYGVNIPPLVPDVLLSLHVRLPEDLGPKLNRSYFVWNYGKPPEVAIEIVSNKEGREDTEKLDRYADVRVSNYFIYDPECFISDCVLRGYQLVGGKLTPLDGERFMLPNVGLGLCLWRGRYEDTDATWLRWADSNWNLIPTGAEAAAVQRERADAESQRADAESQRAESESQRAERNRNMQQRCNVRMSD